MKNFAKYFSAASKDEIILKACEYFGCNKESIFTIVEREGNEILPWIVLAINLEGKSMSAIENMNSSFALYYEPDGVYFEVYPRRGAGSKLDRESVAAYVQRKSIKMLNAPDMLAVLEAGEGQVKIAPPQSEIILGEDIATYISDNEMEGYIRFLPPDKGGAPITFAEIREKIRKGGIVFGLDEEALKDAVNDKSYGKAYLIARGQQPEHGKDGYLEFHFNTGPRTAAPKETGQGRIDYRTLDLFEPIKEGQALVTRHLATMGYPGKSVRGNELKPRAGKEALMPRSKNTILNEEKTLMVAKTSGMVDFINGVLTISNVYTVKGDCDMSIGNIDFDGSVIISGNVISGMIVKASGSITIHGVVEGSEIISGGNIELKRGIQGMDKGKLYAEGSINAQFIERATVIAGQDVVADSIIHCTIEAGRSIVVKGKRGNIMGGNIKATSEITARVIGSTMYTQTDIEVGLVPQKRSRIKFLSAELQKLRVELEKLNKLEQYVSRGAPNMTKENAERILLSTKENKYLNSQMLADYTAELQQLEFEMNNATGGKVHVLDTIYPGARITISNGFKRINEPITYATFKYSEGDIVFVACEAMQK